METPDCLEDFRGLRETDRPDWVLSTEPNLVLIDPKQPHTKNPDLQAKVVTREDYVALVSNMEEAHLSYCQY